MRLSNMTAAYLEATNSKAPIFQAQQLQFSRYSIFAGHYCIPSSSINPGQPSSIFIIIALASSQTTHFTTTINHESTAFIMVVISQYQSLLSMDHGFTAGSILQRSPPPPLCLPPWAQPSVPPLALPLAPDLRTVITESWNEWSCSANHRLQ